MCVIWLPQVRKYLVECFVAVFIGRSDSIVSIESFRTFLAPKCPSLISRIFFKCSSSENHSKLLMIKIKELRNGTTNFPAPKSETESFLGIFPDHFLEPRPFSPPRGSVIAWHRDVVAINNAPSHEESWRTFRSCKKSKVNGDQLKQWK